MDWKNPQTKAAFKKIGIAALVSILIITPWTIRNYEVMGEWIPIKSNAGYENWQSQCLDDDGVLNDKTTFKHPWIRNNEQRKKYIELGEIKFNQHYGRLAWECIKDSPMGYFKRVTNRFVAIFVYYTPAYGPDERRIIPTTIKRVLYPLPLISLIVIFMFRRKQMSAELKAAIWIFVLTLTPYMLVSFVERYLVPLLLAKMIFMLYAADTLIKVLKSKQAQTS